MSGWAFLVRGQGSKALEIDVYDVIGGGMFYGGISARQVRQTLKDNPSAETIKLRINSPGGMVHEGLAIYADLLEHQARKEVLVTGLAGSMASVLMLVGDDIRISAAGFVMIHDPFGLVIGGREEKLRSMADYLAKVRETMVDIYEARTKQKRVDLEKWMKAETWMNATEAKARGFVDSIVPAQGTEKKKAAALAFDDLPLAYASAAFAEFANIPAEVRASLELVEPPAPAPTPKTPEPEGSENNDGEATPMAITLVSILVALGLNENANDAAAVTEISRLKGRDALATKLETATGEAGDAALGTVKAWKTSHEKLPAAEAKLAEQKGANDRAELDSLIKTGRGAQKLTKAEADNVRTRVEGFWKAKAEGQEPTEDQWSLSMARSYVKALSPQAHLVGTDGGDPPAPKPREGAAGLTYKGKAYEDLTSREREALAHEDDELFAKVRRDWERRGQPPSIEDREDEKKD